MTAAGVPMFMKRANFPKAVATSVLAGSLSLETEGALETKFASQSRLVSLHGQHTP